MALTLLLLILDFNHYCFLMHHPTPSSLIFPDGFYISPRVSSQQSKLREGNQQKHSNGIVLNIFSILQCHTILKSLVTQNDDTSMSKQLFMKLQLESLSFCTKKTYQYFKWFSLKQQETSKQKKSKSWTRKKRNSRWLFKMRNKDIRNTTLIHLELYH